MTDTAYFLGISGKKPKMIKPAYHHRRKTGTVARLLLDDAQQPARPLSAWQPSPL
jgi:hypothetical protein